MDGGTMRFTSGSSLDLLADALRRADVTWRTERIEEWGSMSDVERQRWRDLAREAADVVHEETSRERHRVAAD
jgi:hypothetical protein